MTVEYKSNVDRLLPKYNLGKYCLESILYTHKERNVNLIARFTKIRANLQAILQQYQWLDAKSSSIEVIRVDDVISYFEDSF